MESNLSGDYCPKLTPDTIFDYRYNIKDKIALLKIPPKLHPSYLPFLLKMRKQTQKQAKSHSGTFQPGNLVLGGHPQEYNPSDEELIESHIGDIVLELLQQASPQELSPLRSLLKSLPIYRKIIITHMDCMGSGRFFYANPPIETKII